MFILKERLQEYLKCIETRGADIGFRIRELVKDNRGKIITDGELYSWI